MKHTLIRTLPEAGSEAFAGCGHAPMPAARRASGAPPIYVDGVHIAESDIAAEAQNHAASSGAEARAAAARALVIRHLLLRRALELKLEPDGQT
jgi:peptidyl-prolyl cis-trans isomerase C